MEITPDFIRGLIVGEGCFTFSTRRERSLNRRVKIPTFSLKMHVHDKELLIAVRDALGLGARVYEYNHNKRHYVLLKVIDLFTDFIRVDIIIGTMIRRNFKMFHDKHS